MTRERFEQMYGVTVNSLNWETGWNGLFEYVGVGPYTVYRDAAWGYYVAEGSSRIHWAVNLSQYIR